jgi:general secretion pathway protein L
MTILRLFLSPGWPDSGGTLQWALLDSKGTLQGHGHDEAAHWPAAEQCELVLPAGQTVFRRVRLPAGLREVNATVIGFALEEQLANDPAANAYALGGGAKDGERPVAVTALLPLKRALAALRSHGRLVDRIVPEEAFIPAPPEGRWQLAALQGGRVLRADLLSSHFLPYGVVGDALLAALAPSALLLHGDAATLDLPAGLEGQVSGPAPSWRHGLLPATPFDFAQGELAANRSGRVWRPALRSSARILAVGAAILLLGALADAGHWAWRKHVLLRELQLATQDWLPAQPPGSPLLLAGLRKVDELRLAHGQPARLDPLALLGALAGAGVNPGSVHKLTAQPGRLELETGPLAPEQLAQLRTRLAERRYQLNSRPSSAGGWQLTLSPEE